ncbi:putative gustatory receptor 28b [Monomorium pharaonis]|uniref:putative gustatory receptor 28b n=1 Tax=Monomorium pharaonis TaxID=307658 RepID=UPI001746C32C|nr:putative gustatory receptor 28b [Monomorium pharaonis]
MFTYCRNCKQSSDKKRLFHATDFQSLMYVNFTICEILGVFPYKIKGSTFDTSKLQYVLFTIVTCAACFYELMMFYILNLSGRVKLEVPRIISYNFHFVLGAFAMIVLYVSSGPRMRLLQNMQEISSKLPPKSYQKLSKLIHAKDIVTMFFLLWPLMVVIVYKREMVIDTSLEPLRLYIAIIVFQMDMLYINCVCVLKACFKDIKNNLEDLQKFMVNDISSVYHEQRNPLTELKALKKQHLMVSNVVQMLNINFSLQLLATMCITFKQITFFLYFHVVQWQNGISFTFDTQVNSDYFVSQVMFYITRMSLIVWACETGKNQATEISTTVHDVLNITNNEQTKYELQLFSLQILHCNNIFSTKSLIVDATLLTAVSK